jgi:hypothetical protein
MSLLAALFAAVWVGSFEYRVQWSWDDQVMSALHLRWGAVEYKETTVDIADQLRDLWRGHGPLPWRYGFSVGSAREPMVTPSAWLPRWDSIYGRHCSVPLWPLIVAAATPAVALWVQDRRRLRKLRATLCPTCGYSRVGLTGNAKCPECGTVPTT